MPTVRKAQAYSVHFRMSSSQPSPMRPVAKAPMAKANGTVQKSELIVAKTKKHVAMHRHHRKHFAHVKHVKHVKIVKHAKHVKQVKHSVKAKIAG